MGQDATETLSEIEASRQRVQQDIDLLTSRLPDGDQLAEQAKIVGGVAAAAGVGLAVLYMTSKRSLAKRRRHREATRQAEALADVLAERDIPLGQTVLERPVLELQPSNGSSDTLNVATLIASLAALAITVAQFLSRKQD